MNKIKTSITREKKACIKKYYEKNRSNNEKEKLLQYNYNKV